MNLNNYKEKQLNATEKSVREVHNFYLFLFGYVAITLYLHYIDLKDGNYDWAYWSWILMTFSVIWMAVITFSFPLKNRLILKEMKKKKSELNLKN